MCSGRKYKYNTFKPHYFGFMSILIPVNTFSNQECAMRRGMRKPRELKLRRYTSRMVATSDYLDSFPRANPSDKIGET